MPSGGAAGLAERAVAMRGGKRKSTMEARKDVLPQKEAGPSYSESLKKRKRNPSVAAAAFRLANERS